MPRSPRTATPPPAASPPPRAARSRRPTIDPRIATAARVEVVPIMTLVQWDRNPHQGNDAEVQASVRRFGQVTPIVRAPDGWIISGNTTLRAMIAEGFTECAVVTLDATETEQVAFALTANRTAQLGTDDDALVLSLLTEVGVISGTGYTDDDLSDLRARIQEMEAGALATDGPTFFNPETNLRDNTPSYDGYLDRYQQATVRAVILNYELPVFEWVQEHASTVREDLGLETNADVFVALVAHHLGIDLPTAPEAVAS